MKPLIALLFLLLTVFQSCHSQEPIGKPIKSTIGEKGLDTINNPLPRSQRWINDFVHIFSIDEVKTLDSIVISFEKESTVEIGVVTLDSAIIGNHDFELFTLELANRWGIGKKEKNNGILIAISPDLRQLRIHNGFGIERNLSDLETKSIIENKFIPKFKDAKFFEGTKEGIIAIINRLKQNGL